MCIDGNLNKLALQIDSIMRPYRLALTAFEEIARKAELLNQPISSIIPRYGNLLGAPLSPSFAELDSYKKMINSIQYNARKVDSLFSLASSIIHLSEHVNKKLYTFSAVLNSLQRLQNPASFSPLFIEIGAALDSLKENEIANIENSHHSKEINEQVIDQLDELIQDVVIQAEKETSIVIPQLISVIKKLAAKGSILLISVILQVVLTSIITPALDNYIKFQYSNKTYTIQQIKKTTQSQFQLDELANYRFVSANVLNVRKSPSIKSSILDKVYFGKVIRLIQKGRHWSKVQYLNSEDELIDGWVFSRYMKKFK